MNPPKTIEYTCPYCTTTITTNNPETLPVCQCGRKEWKRNDYFHGKKFVPKKLADELLTEYHVITPANMPVPYYYQEGYYQKARHHLTQQINQRLQHDASEHYAKETLAYLTAITYTHNHDEPEPTMINLTNGIYDIEEQQLLEHNPSHFFLNRLPIEYTTTAECPRIKQFLREITETEADALALEEFAGYCLYRGMPKHRAFLLIGEGANGKCQKAGDKVLMANGTWKNIEDINVGEEVASPQIDGGSIPARVIGKHSRFENNVYEVREKTRGKRLLYTCAANHEIPIIRNYTKRTSKDDSTPRTRERKLFHYDAEHISKLGNEKSEICSFTTTPINFNQPDAYINPYCLGAWLGDGCYSYKPNPRSRTSTRIYRVPQEAALRGRRYVNMTTADIEIINEFKKAYPNIHIRTYSKPNNKASSYTFNLNDQFVKELEFFELQGKGSGTKFIPKECLLSSIEYRRELLSGLIDTDGFVSKTGQITLCTKSKQLATDITNLVFSLGGFSILREITKTIKERGFTGNYYDVSIQFKNSKENIRLRTWKKDRLTNKKDEPRHIAIECVKTNPQMVYGIEIAGPSHWYVTNEWMVTHNSTYLNLLQGLLGKENYASTPLQDLIMRPFLRARLYGKLANIFADLPNSALKSGGTGIFKALTGNDGIDAELKFVQDPVNFTNHAKLIFSCNQIPRSDDDSIAFWRRWTLIQFPRQFTDENRDPDLPAKLASELPGFLNLALTALNRLRNNKWKFSNEKSEATTRQNYLKHSDPFQYFVETSVEITYEPEHFISKDDFYAAYCGYVKNEKLGFPEPKNIVSKRLYELVPGIQQERKRTVEGRVNVWTGIRLKTGEKPQDYENSPTSTNDYGNNDTSTNHFDSQHRNGIESNPKNPKKWTQWTEGLSKTVSSLNIEMEGNIIRNKENTLTSSPICPALLGESTKVFFRRNDGEVTRQELLDFMELAGHNRAEVEEHLKGLVDLGSLLQPRAGVLKATEDYLR